MLDHHKLVRAAEALDPVPFSVSRLVAIVARDHWAFSDVEQVLALDQALTGRLLQIANSAWSASLMRIGTVKDAVIRIGIGPTVSFAMGACVGPAFRRALPQFGLGEGTLWRHSVAASLAAEVISAMSPADVPAESVTAALLHDVGKLVLARHLTPELAAAVAEARLDPGRSPVQAEVDVLGVHHGELGGIIARHWNLPDRLADAITYHHVPDRLADAVCDVVAVANAAAKATTDPAAPAVLPVSSVTRLQLPAHFFDRLCQHVERRLDDVLARYDQPPVTMPVRKTA
jgi:putative nucleotidyltransferase with HDIG domain